MKNIDLEKVKKVHFIGIGGIGMSALAKMMIGEGKIVSGSDASESKITENLEDIGAKISIGHKKENLPSDADLVCHTIAALADNPELIQAKDLNIPILSYPEMLGLISRDYFTVAVSGTHGKTTTTAMLAEIAMKVGLDPTVVVGSLLSQSKTNFIKGKSKLMIVEACEYRRSFLHLSPNILIITNIEGDHLDYFADLADIMRAFRELAEKVPQDGAVICDLGDSDVASVTRGLTSTIIDYSKEKIDFDLLVPGDHNLRNAKAAFAVSKRLFVDEDTAKQALEEFSGTWRRAEFKGEMKNGALVYDDYAHHPTEIRETLKGFRQMFPERNITVVFQPHLYSRTKFLFKEFTESFTDADEVLVLPIYAAREAPDPAVNSVIFASKLDRKEVPAVYMDDFQTAVEHIQKNTNRETLVITMGAGDVYKVADMLI